MSEKNNTIKTGTHEWAKFTINIQKGCENDCKYCYAKRIAMRFDKGNNRMPIHGWDTPEINTNLITKYITHFPTKKGKIMFPSTHDITENNVLECCRVIWMILYSQNKLLIVSKPRIKAIQQLCKSIMINSHFKDQIEFRLTIGALDEETRNIWEPKAPSISERLDSLRYLLRRNFKVSISCEPLLNPNIIPYILTNYANENSFTELWIGAMNYFKGPALDYLSIYKQYRNQNKVLWKDSFVKKLIKQILKLARVSYRGKEEEILSALNVYPELQNWFIVHKKQKKEKNSQQIEDFPCGQQVPQNVGLNEIN